MPESANTTTIHLELDEALSTIASPGFSTVKDQLALVKRMAINVDLHGQKLTSFQQLFFSDKTMRVLRLQNGIVETPGNIASLMVSIAIDSVTKPNAQEECQQNFVELSWLDPCSGAGAFPIAIIERYLSATPRAKTTELPKLTVWEESPLGLFVTLCSIRILIEQTQVSLETYIDSGRLNFALGDTLSELNETPDLLSSTPSFDVVIANPPYVRATRIKQAYRDFLKAKFPSTYSGSADLYSYFLASAISSLRNAGVAVFISPASFVRAKSGLAIRRYIQQYSELEIFLDLDEIPIFTEADVHSAVYLLKKGRNQDDRILYEHIQSSEQLTSICLSPETIGTAFTNLSVPNGWAFFPTKADMAAFEKKFKDCQPLSSFGITVYSGVRPGFAKAFILDEESFQKFSLPTQERWIRKVILPPNILRWHGAKKQNYMLIIPTGSKDIPAEILAHFEQYREQLETRAEARDSVDWFCLRSCSYYEKMAQEKIVFPDLSAHQRFAMSSDNVYVCDGSYFFDSSNMVLLGILNSATAHEYFTNRCSSVGNLKSRGRFRFKKAYLQDFPIPRHAFEESAIATQITEVVRELLNNQETPALKSKLDSLVEHLYLSRND